MLKKQQGVTLLETVLGIAILGMALSFGASLLLKYIHQREIHRTASEIVELQSNIKKLTEAVYLRTQDPTGVIQRQVNPLLTEPTIGWVKLSENLNWMKKTDCKLPDLTNGVLPVNTIDTYLDCGFSADKMDLRFAGTNAEFIHYSNISFLLAKRYVRSAWSSYVHISNRDIGDFLNVLTEIPRVLRPDGFAVNEKHIYAAEFIEGKNGWEKRPGTEIAYSELLGPNLQVMKNYIEAVTKGRSYPGFYISAVYEADVFLKRDGSVPIAAQASLCWDNLSGKGKPCIRASTDSVDPSKDLLVVETGLAFGALKKKTPIEASYQTFTNGQPLRVPFIECPNRVGDLVMENKMAAISSSYSAGSETATNFTNPGNIISSGTLGASGKHALVSGMSLEWNPDLTAKQWVIEGAVGFDGNYAAQNNNASVLRNPKSMSFIVMQWCEEK